MTVDVKLTRAITSEFLARKYKPLLLLLIITLIVTLVGAIYLMTLSLWWLLVVVPVTLFMILGLILAVAAQFIIRSIRPNLTSSQSSNVNKFVDKLERVAENLQPPIFIIMFRVIRDVIRPRGRTFLQAATEDSTTLHADYLKLQREFKTDQ